jgi:hypothetical protein
MVDQDGPSFDRRTSFLGKSSAVEEKNPRRKRFVTDLTRAERGFDGIRQILSSNTSADEREPRGPLILPRECDAPKEIGVKLQAGQSHADALILCTKLWARDWHAVDFLGTCASRRIDAAQTP